MRKTNIQNVSGITYYRLWLLAGVFGVSAIMHGCHGRGGRMVVEQYAEAVDSVTSGGCDTFAGRCGAAVPAKSRMARQLDSLGFRNIAEADSTIAIDLMYARADNFTGEVLYDDLHEAYLHPDALESLLLAQRLLRELHPDYRLVVYDALRPMSVQQRMWDKVKGTSRYRYVSNPARGGGLHNYGLAVDLSILDANGCPLPMGTPVDHLGPEAHITDEAQLVEAGKLTSTERANRQLLRRVMKEAGFRPLPSEWWHFNRVSRAVAKEKYRVIP